eukprot:CAMPEP_0201669036 /NCGR_PEP_ID=MMETSP0494-20130426/22045_1 /ASSEMBLY_ACC=CAM_ASM_000839 /TAXON_ID=420259 /ORGANISM="Thalassiosira gravida, Strain GMp14c1" /LENGTH=260 /DNA_ID=CAMNT_0048149651 /DNA_START=36 /DNA_END=819 /DNA_ORIENTATION=-
MAGKALCQSCFLLENALTPQEQIELFQFIHERDATDWDNFPPCMNPTPKTLQLSANISEKNQHAIERKVAATARTISIDPNSQPKNVVVELVEKAVDSSIASSNDNNDTPPTPLLQPIKSISLAVIRYCIQGTSSTVGYILPPHVDHCNDGSWVFLFSLGCTASFFVQFPTTDRDGDGDQERRHTFQMTSGDVLVFDPSSQARILHGVTGVVDSASDGMAWEERGETFGVLRESDLGCNVEFHLGDGFLFGKVFNSTTVA